MTIHCFDEALEAYLSGRPVPAEAGLVTAFGETVRRISAQPGRPSPELAELLATGLPTGHVPAGTRSAHPSPEPAHARAPGGARRRRTMFGFLAAAVAKFMSIGAVAQAAAGVGIVAASVTGAAAAGALPGPVQDSVSSVVSAVSPFDLPLSEDEPAATDEVTTETGEVPAETAEPTAEPTTEPTDPTGEPTAEPTTEPTDPTGEPTTDPTTPTGEPTTDPTTPTTAPDRVPFGRSVSEDARDGGVDGREISDAAHAKNHRQETGPETQAPQRPTAAPADPHQPDAEETRPAPEVSDSAGRGQGGHGGEGGQGGQGGEGGQGHGSGHR